jgi:hypothetical protein
MCSLADVTNGLKDEPWWRSGTVLAVRRTEASMYKSSNIEKLQYTEALMYRSRMSSACLHVSEGFERSEPVLLFVCQRKLQCAGASMGSSARARSSAGVLGLAGIDASSHEQMPQ